MNNLKIQCCAILLIVNANSVLAATPEQTQAESKLQAEIAQMDHRLFDEAFNHCDLELYKQLTTRDFEFYDDRSGLNKSIEKEIRSFEDRCSRPFAVTRQLVSSIAYGLSDYGALQIGEHEFYEDGTKVERAKFITIWERSDDSWIIKRAISYEHRGVESEASDQEIDAALEDEINGMDYLLFDGAFNSCDLELHKRLTSNDFEFYDDRSGLNKSIDNEILSFEDRCSRPFAVTRKLVSSKAYALGDYGAVQIGEHEFYEDGRKVERAKFIIIWEREDDSWILRRAISYGHQGVESGTNDNAEIGYELREDYKLILDDIVPKLLEKYLAPAAGIGIIQNGNIEFIKVYGEHQKGLKAPSDTIFNVASITKPVVSAAVLKLVEKGEWDLDEPLFHYFTDPDVAGDDRSRLITTRHCLSHTTGFKNWRWGEADGKLQFNFEPGTKFQYSGEGMEYLRHALENKFGVGLEEIVDSLIFAPLKMKDATLGWIPEEDEARFSKWYDSQGRLHDIDFRTPKINAADDLLLTVEDMLLFSNAIMKQEIIEGALYDEMVKPQVAINQKLNQGLGWVVYNGLRDGETILNHDGGDPGVVATLILFPTRENAIAIFVNSNNGASVTNAIVSTIVENGIDVVEGLHWTNAIPAKVEIEESLLDKYAGTYDTDHDFSISFSVEGQSLITQSAVFPRVTLYPRTDTEFFPIPFEIYFRFVEENNRIKVQLLTDNRVVDLEGIKRQ